MIIIVTKTWMTLSFGQSTHNKYINNLSYRIHIAGAREDLAWAGSVMRGKLNDSKPKKKTIKNQFSMISQNAKGSNGNLTWLIYWDIKSCLCVKSLKYSYLLPFCCSLPFFAVEETVNNAFGKRNWRECANETPPTNIAITNGKMAVVRIQNVQKFVKFFDCLSAVFFPFLRMLSASSLVSSFFSCMLSFLSLPRLVRPFASHRFLSLLVCSQLLSSHISAYIYIHLYI